MVQSMTGYGQSVGEYNGKKIQIEIKSLNGKATDVRLRIPNNFKEKEIALRSIILEKLLRGKIDVSITSVSGGEAEEYSLNRPLFVKYFNEINSLKSELGIEEGDVIQTILRIPNVVMAVDDKMSDEEWEAIQSILGKAIENFQEFRSIEGRSLYNDFNLRIENISSLLQQTGQFEEERLEKVKNRIKKNLNAHFAQENIDENRFEQELMFYIERLDITEEKVRLEQHCKYFIQVLNSDKTVKGKKLGFISQEMGREINTLGAKSQNSDLQQIVVSMKDELEKIKEQIANIV